MRFVELDLTYSMSAGVQTFPVGYAEPTRHETGLARQSAESISISLEDMARRLVSDSDNHPALKESIRVDVEIDVFAESSDENVCCETLVSSKLRRNLDWLLIHECSAENADSRQKVSRFLCQSKTLLKDSHHVSKMESSVFGSAATGGIRPERREP